MFDIKFQILIMLIIAALSLLFTHALLERFFLFLEIKKSPQILLINIVIFLNVTLVFFLTFFFFESPDLIYIFIYSLIFFNCISYSYFHLFNLSETGRRIRFLMDLEAKQVNVYNSEEIILRRINRLSLMGQIKKK